MMKTIAIVGSHPDTRKAFDFDRTDCDVWLFNEAMKEAWAKRANGVFQMHQPVIWRSKVNRNDPKHYDWLKSGNTPTIYMIDQFDDVPMCQPYPLEEIKQEFFGNSNIEHYFTSSPAYAIALAIYQGYERIEVYGIEMETNTEYAHQRVGVALWCGIAIGRGVHLEFHSRKFFNEPLYGYDGGATIERDYFIERVKELKPQVIALDEQFTAQKRALDVILNGFVADYKAGYTGIEQAILDCAQTSHDFGVMDACMQVNERYIKKIDLMVKESGRYLLGRQEYEGGMLGATKEAQTAQEKYNVSGLQLENIVPQLRNATGKDRRAQVVSDLNKVLAVYFKTSASIGICSGVVRENTVLMAKHDLMVQAAGGEKSYQVMMDEMAVTA